MPLAVHRLARVLTLPLLLAAFVCSPAAASQPRAADASRVSTITLPNGNQYTLQTPSDLHVSLYASGLTSARFMALGPHNDVFVGSWWAGAVSVLLNRKGRTQA